MAYASDREYHRLYGDMCGVDFSGDGSGIPKNRFAYLQNMFRDYDGDGESVTESIPGFRRVLELDGEIRAFHLQKRSAGDLLHVHAGTSLYSIPTADLGTSAEPTLTATLAAAPSASVSVGEELFLLDGTNYLAIDALGAATRVGEGTGERPPYVPVTFVNGETYEQRNLLSSRFRERYTVTSPDRVAHGTPGLAFRILDASAMTCAVASIGVAEGTKIYIPSVMRVGTGVFTVTEIAKNAFRNCTNVELITVPEGIVKVGEGAFSGCIHLQTAAFPDTLTEIGSGAFEDCTALLHVYLGQRIRKIGEDIFSGASATARLHFPGTEEAFAEIEGADGVSVTKVYNSSYGLLRPEIPVFSPTASVTKVTKNGIQTTFTAHTENGLVVGVVLPQCDRLAVTGSEIVIEGTFAQNSVAGFTETHTCASPASAITGCRLAKIFDGRLFLSGNPAYPNTVFYAARRSDGVADPTYFGVFNTFDDGIGRYRVKALLPVGGRLAVFKEGDDGGGSIFYHAPADTGEDLVPRHYPVSFVHSGIAAKGEVLSFYDDPVFVSENGISALERTAVAETFRVGCRSHNVNPRLLAEDLPGISLCRWQGYLAVCCSGNVYLADSRKTFLHETGEREYEWFFLTDVGTYENDSRVFRYAMATEGFDPPPEPDGIAEGTVISEGSGEHEVLYVTDGDKRFAVYRTEEYTGGDFSPAKVVFSVGDRLLFGTAAGTVCLFNTDLRGTPPDFLLADPAFDPAAYALLFGRRVHPAFYAFDRHAPRYALKTAMDDCGIPHLAKTTVKGSLTVKCRAFAASAVTVEVGTDRSGYREVTNFPACAFSFPELDFSSLSLENTATFTVGLGEKEKGWVEKQIALYSDAFCSPIGIAGIAYRYTVAGSIKNK